MGSVEGFVPVFPDGFVAEAADFGGYFEGGAGVGDFKLFEGVGGGDVAARLGLAAGAHGGDAEAHHVGAECRRLAGGVGDVDIVVEDAEGKCELCELAVGHHHFRLVATLGRTHAREVDRVAGAPVVAAQILEVTRHHGYVGAPVFKAYQHSHADFMHSGAAHAVEAVDAPFKNRFHAPRMIVAVVGFVVGFLEADHAVEAALGQAVVVALFERHHFNGQIVEVGAGGAEHFLQIVNSVERRKFTRHDEQIFKRAEPTDGLALCLDLVERQRDALQRIGVVEAAIDAGIGAGVGDIHGDVHRYRLAEALQSVASRELCHLFEIRLGGGGDERHEIVDGEMLLAQSNLNVARRLGENRSGRFVPIVVFQFVVKHLDGE